jgi:hypothetical protein
MTEILRFSLPFAGTIYQTTAKELMESPTALILSGVVNTITQ